MDHGTKLELWKQLLDKLDSEATKDDDKNTFQQLNQLLKHFSPIAAIRHQKGITSCTRTTLEIITKVFDRLDCSDRSLLSSFLELLLTFGYFRIAQITYSVSPSSIDLIAEDQTQVYMITRSKWYDLEPLLPSAGSLGWKGVMTSSLVKEETQLMPFCLQLLMQKLHFLSIVANLHQFSSSKEVIIRNGRKVAEKLIELIKDAAYNDENIIGIDANLFNLLMTFAEDSHSTDIIDSIIQDLFKPIHQNGSCDRFELRCLNQLISEHILNKPMHQDVFVSGMIQHLKCNLIRRKRRHSVESANEKVTIESLLNQILEDADVNMILSQSNDIEIPAKALQSTYLRHWTNLFKNVTRMATLTSNASIRLFGTCSIILVVIPETDSEVICNLIYLASKAIENIPQAKFDKLCNIYNPDYLIQLTQLLIQKNYFDRGFDSPIQQIYRAYIGKYLRRCVLRGAKLDTEKFNQFITFICDKKFGSNASRLLPYLYIRELAGCVEVLKSRISNKMGSVFSDWAGLCCKRLYKFIKRNSKSKDEFNESTSDMDLDVSVDQSNKGSKHSAVILALVCILRLSIELKNQEFLETYSDLISKLFSNVVTRIKDVISIVRLGQNDPSSPLDAHITKLLNLYIQHREMLGKYLNYDLIDTLTGMLVESLKNSNDTTSESKKKKLYKQIKTKLEFLQEQGEKSSNVYQTIINQQYATATDIAVGCINDMNREESCREYRRGQMVTLNDVSEIIISHGDTSGIRNLLDSIVQSLETCDPLDHDIVLYLLLLLRSASSKSKSTQNNLDMIKGLLPRISCSLVRIAKTVDMGPSIHAFTKPGCHLSNRSIQCCTYANCIGIYSQLMERFSPNDTGHMIADALQLAIGSNLQLYAKHSLQLHKYFIELGNATTRLLKSICIARRDQDTLKSTLPIFLTMLSHLIRCLIMASDRRKLSELEIANGDTQYQTHKHFENQLELIAIDIGRALNNLSLLKVKLVEFAPHVISSYVKDSQRASCPDFIRLHLNEGLFRIFNLVDAHQKDRQSNLIEEGIQRKTIAGKAKGSMLDMIHARLDQASREVFRDMHDNYTKFHRYSGKC